LHVPDSLSDKSFVGNAVARQNDLVGRELTTGVIRATAKQTHQFYVCG